MEVEQRLPGRRWSEGRMVWVGEVVDQAVSLRDVTSVTQGNLALEVDPDQTCLALNPGNTLGVSLPGYISGSIM